MQEIPYSRRSALNIEPASASAASTISKETELANPRGYLQVLGSVLERLRIADIEAAIDRLFEAYVQNHGVYIFGNGGSAALASHTSCDLSKGTAVNGNRPFRVISLTDNVPLITAWANDLHYDDIFSAQLRPLIQRGDIAFAISGSGNSPNVLKALQIAREAGATNIGMAGFQGGKVKALCDICITVPSENMQHIEDAHVCLMHAMFLALRNRIEKSQPVHEAHKAKSAAGQ
jgi:phosphoheptose isomerase